jgi:hypothetical protein
MNEKKTEKILAFWGLVAAIAFGLPGLFEWLGISPKAASGAIIYLVPFLGVVIGFFVYTQISRLIKELRRIEQESLRIKSSFQRLHQISHKLRDALHDTIDKKAKPGFDKKHEQQNRNTVLNAVCNDISELFNEVTEDRSLACIRLMSAKHTTPPTAFLEGFCNNHIAAGKGMIRTIDVSKHTRYEKVHTVQRSTNTLHYFCADVEEEIRKKNYYDPDYQQEPYGSTIVVPIRCVNEPTSFLGFLKIQTDQPKRLNDGWHVELLAALADEIFLFLDCSHAMQESGLISSLSGENRETTSKFPALTKSQ